MFEKLWRFEWSLILRLRVSWFRSMAMVNPAIVIRRAVSFRYAGIVRIGRLVGGILLDKRYPAKMLPIRRRLMELISWGLFSLIAFSEENRGCPIRAKKMIRVL